MWCADIAVAEQDDPKCPATDKFSDIQSAGKLSALALPLSYLVGTKHPHANKYCVITNWWKHRMKDGWYRLPTLDPTLYGCGKLVQKPVNNALTFHTDPIQDRTDVSPPDKTDPAVDVPASVLLVQATQLPRQGVLQQQSGTL